MNQVETDRTIPNNKLDINICYDKGTSMLIDDAISGDRKVMKKEAEKILNYKDLTTEIQCVWNVKHVIIGATGTISKSFRKYLATYWERAKSRSYRKYPYWPLHTYFRKH
jgi:hypothetical protein